MWLSERIRTALSGDSAELFDDQGRAIPAAAVQSTLNGLRQLLSRVPVGQPVGIHLAHGHEYFLAVLVCMEVGVPYVPMNIGWPPARLAYLVETSNISLIIDQEKLQSPATARPSFDAPQRSMTPDDHLYTIYTSGTTGTPKGARISRGAFTAYVKFISEVIELSPEERQLSVLELSWDGALTEVAVFLLTRSRIAFSRAGRDMFKLGEEIDSFRPTVMKIVPTTAAMLMRRSLVKRYSYTSLRSLILGGARTMPALYDSLHEYFGGQTTVYNHYGPTEFTVGSHVHRLTFDRSVDFVRDIITIGRPSSVTHCRVLSEDGASTDRPGVEGELLLSGDQLMSGYEGAAEATDKATITIDGRRYYRTGDLSFRDDSGRWFICGRTDETIKRKGYRINLRSMDACISRLSSVSDCATVSVSTATGEPRVTTFVVPSAPVGDEAVFKAEVLGELRASLPDTELPDELRLCDRLPTSSSGKVDRKRLIELLNDPPAHQTE